MIGQTLGHYRIESKLGEGGMGVVYRARDLSLNRSVALKFLSSEVADQERRRRFQQEAQTASSLNHPHILTVFEAGTIDGQQYLVTEYVDGWTLGEWVRREQPSLRQMVELMINVADALATAHQAGILHRDIKPQNILVSKSGYAKLADFGLAKVLEPGSEDPEGATLTAGKTRPGTILGTVAYMSPEQAAGRRADARSDVFAFGVVLYEMLAGRRPFEGSSDVDVLHAILHAPPRPLAELRPDLPFELRLLVERALEKEPAERYQSMREVVVDLRRVQRGRSSEAVPTDGGKPVAARSVRRWPLATALAAAALLAAGFLLWRLWSSDYFWKNPLASARFSRLTDSESTVVDAALSPDGKLVAFLSDRDGPFDVWVSQVGSGQFTNLTRGQFRLRAFPLIRNVGFAADGSHVWFVSGSSLSDITTWVAPSLGGAPRKLLQPGLHPTWSPDGTRLLYHEPAPGDPVFVADANGANPKQIFVDQPGMHCHFLTWSPDGRHVYFSRGVPTANEMDLWRIPATGGQPERLTHHRSMVGYPAFLDERTLLYVATAGDGSGSWIYAVDVARRKSQRVSAGLEQYHSLAASIGAGGAPRLAATVSRPSGSLWTVPISEAVAADPDAVRFSPVTMRAASPRYGPGYVLYLSLTGGASGLWKAQGGATTELWKGSAGGLIAPPAVSADGARVAFAIRRQDRTYLYAISSDGLSPQPIAESLHVRGALAWSPDGQWLAVGGEDSASSGLFKVPLQGGPPLRLAEGICANPVWSPDGRWVAYSGPLGGAFLRLRGVTPEGKPFPLPEIDVRYEYESYRFLPSGQALVLLLGGPRAQDFWLLDLGTGRRRQLTQLKPGPFITSFDVSPDGKQIIFDRLREDSDVVIIDLER